MSLDQRGKTDILRSEFLIGYLVSWFQIWFLDSNKSLWFFSWQTSIQA